MGEVVRKELRLAPAAVNAVINFPNTLVSYVRFQLARDGIMSLAEVEVFGYPGPSEIRGKVIKTTDNRCLDVANAYQLNSGRFLQWFCHGGSNQRFNIENRFDEHLLIRTVHTSECLTIRGFGNNFSLVKRNCAHLFK